MEGSTPDRREHTLLLAPFGSRPTVQNDYTPSRGGVRILSISSVSLGVTDRRHWHRSTEIGHLPTVRLSTFHAPGGLRAPGPPP